MSFEHVEDDVLGRQCHDSTDVADGPRDGLVGEHQRAGAERSAQEQGRPQQRQHGDPGRLGGGDFLVGGHAAIDNADGHQHRDRDRERQQAGDDVGQDLQCLEDSQAVLTDLLEGSAHDHQHRQHPQHAQEDVKQLAEDVALEQGHGGLAADSGVSAERPVAERYTAMSLRGSRWIGRSV